MTEPAGIEQPLNASETSKHTVDAPDAPMILADRMPLVAGTFAFYEDGQGGIVAVADTPQFGVQRKHIPPAMVKLAMSALNGEGGGGLMGRLASGLMKRG